MDNSISSFGQFASQMLRHSQADFQNNSQRSRCCNRPQVSSQIEQFMRVAERPSMLEMLMHALSQQNALPQKTLRPQLQQQKQLSGADQIKNTLIQVGSEYIPEGFQMINVGDQELGFALPEAEALQFTDFLNSTAGYMGGLAGSELGNAFGGMIGANSSQSGALSAAGGAFGSAAASGAMAAATATTATAGGVGAAAASSAAAAWPVAVVIAAYTAFSNIKSMKSAVGGGPLTDDEIKVALDSFGLEQFVEKATPRELSKFVPQELDYVINPHRVIGKMFFGSGKHEDQIIRDRIRDHLSEIGMAEVINGSHHVRLADGSMYDIGVDGRHKLRNIGAGERAPYSTDPTNPLTDQVIGWVNPLTVVLTGAQQKPFNDFTAYLVNAALSNTDSLQGAKQNVLSLLESSGLEAYQLTGLLGQLQLDEKITAQEYRAYMNGIATLL